MRHHCWLRSRARERAPPFSNFDLATMRVERVGQSGHSVHAFEIYGSSIVRLTTLYPSYHFLHSLDTRTIHRGPYREAGEPAVPVAERRRAPPDPSRGPSARLSPVRQDTLHTHTHTHQYTRVARLADTVAHRPRRCSLKYGATPTGGRVSRHPVWRRAGPIGQPGVSCPESPPHAPRLTAPRRAFSSLACACASGFAAFGAPPPSSSHTVAHTRRVASWRRPYGRRYVALSRHLRPVIYMAPGADGVAA